VTTERKGDMIAVTKPLFKLGQVVATPGALEALEKAHQPAWELISLHVAGKWGVVEAEDAEANNQALKDGSRLLSAYILKDGKTKIWIITEAQDDNGNRAATTLLLPSEY
jgi:hypothetical protein